MNGFEYEAARLTKSFLTMCSWLIILIGIPVVSKIIYLINTKIRNIYVDEDKYLLVKNRTASAIITILFMLGILYSPIAFFNCGTYDFGGIFEKHSYTEDFYVYVGDHPNATKQYKVKATIRKIWFENESRYYIKKLYWTNGGYINFSDGHTLGERIYPYFTTDVAHYDSDTTYYVMLTNERVS